MPNSACQTKKKIIPASVIGDEKWIYFQNLKRKKSWIDPAQPSTSSRPNRFRRKTMLCVWWDQEGVYYELLKPGETVNAHRYHQLIELHRALREKRSHYRKKHDKLIFLHDNALSHTSTTWSKTTWRHSTGKCYPIPLTHQTWHFLTITCFRQWATRSLSGNSILTKTSENGLMSGLPRKMRNFFGVVYTNCPKDGKNV